MLLGRRLINESECGSGEWYGVSHMSKRILCGFKKLFFGCGEVQYFDLWDNNRTVAAAMPSSVFEEHIKQHGDLKLLMADTPHNYKTKKGSCFYFHTFFPFHHFSDAC